MSVGYPPSHVASATSHNVCKWHFHIDSLESSSWPGILQKWVNFKQYASGKEAMGVVSLLRPISSQVHETSGPQDDPGHPGNNLQSLTAPTWASVAKTNAPLLRRKQLGWKRRSGPAESQGEWFHQKLKDVAFQILFCPQTFRNNLRWWLVYRKVGNFHSLWLLDTGQPPSLQRRPLKPNNINPTRPSHSLPFDRHFCFLANVNHIHSIMKISLLACGQIR